MHWLFERRTSFLNIGANSSYWLIGVDKADREKPASALHHGIYQFCTMTFGLENSPATFHRGMNTISYSSK